MAKHTYQLNRTHVGNIEANGTAFCYGYSTLHHNIAFLDVAGPTETLKTIKGLVNTGRNIRIKAVNGPDIFLSSTGAGDYEVMQKKVQYGLVHMIMVHNHIRKPLYAEKSTTFIYDYSDDQLLKWLQHHLHNLLLIPVLHSWSKYLFQAGEGQKLLQRCDNRGSGQFWALRLDQALWQMEVQKGLAEGYLDFPPLMEQQVFKPVPVQAPEAPKPKFKATPSGQLAMF